MDFFQQCKSSVFIPQYFNKRLIMFGAVHYIFITQKFLTAMG
jgi:hypothetical protein